MNGKGSARRPAAISRQELEDRWTRTFGGTQPSTHNPMPQDEELVVYPEFKDAYVGIIERFGQPAIVCYDYDKVIALLMDGGMHEDEAVEWFEYNTLGAWVGETTPCFLRRGADPADFA